MNKEASNLTADQLAYLMAANQQLFAAAAAAAAQAANAHQPQLPNPSSVMNPSPIPALTPQHLSNNVMASWLAGLSAFQTLQKQQLGNQQQQQQYASAAPTYDPSANATAEYTTVPRLAEPTYVNAKQYHRILKRRQARGILEAYFARTRREREEKPYMHESRHRHAMKRPRGPGGRFLTKSEIEKLKMDSTQFEEEMPPFKKHQCET